MTLTNFEQAKHRLLKKLSALDPRLSYHSINHTLDVVKQAERIAVDEAIVNERELYLLKIAALYHDSGFLKTYNGHEEISCSFFLSDAANLHINKNEIQLVQELIMVTKISNKPQTLLEKILRDADLDYLGRPDFFEIAESLRKELMAYNLIANDREWEITQLAFLKDQHYFTKSSQILREPVKKANYHSLL